MHQQETWELSYVITGRGVRMIGSAVEPFASGEIVLIPPNIPHCWTFDNQFVDAEGKIENISVFFNDDFPDMLGASFPELQTVAARLKGFDEAVSFAGDTLSRMQSIMVGMKQQSDIERLLSMMRIVTLMTCPAKTINRGEYDNKTSDRRMQHIYLYIANNYQQAITLRDIAEHVHLENSSFCVFFKKMTGKSFFAFLLEYRVNSAARLLINTDKNIADICLSSGFRDVPYFNRIFKRIKGVTPSQYRVEYA